MATTGGGGGLGGSIGLHIATLCLMSSCRAASSALSFFSSACASSSEALSTGVGSGGGWGAGGAGVSCVATLSDGSTGAQARRSHEASSSRIRNSRPHSRAPHQRDHRKAAGTIAGALASTAAGPGGRPPARSRHRRRHEALEARERIGLVAPGGDHRLAVDQIDVVVRRPARGELQRAADQPRFVACLRAGELVAEAVDRRRDGRRRRRASAGARSSRVREAADFAGLVAYQSMPSPDSRSCGSASRLAGPSPKRRRMTVSSWPATACRGSPRTPSGRTPKRVVRIKVGPWPIDFRRSFGKTL